MEERGEGGARSEAREERGEGGARSEERGEGGRAPGLQASRPLGLQGRSQAAAPRAQRHKLRRSTGPGSISLHHICSQDMSLPPEELELPGWAAFRREKGEFRIPLAGWLEGGPEKKGSSEFRWLAALPSEEEKGGSEFSWLAAFFLS